MRKVVPGFDGKGGDVSEGVADDDGDGGFDGVAGGEGEACEVADSGLELVEEGGGVEGEDGLGQDGAVVVDAADLHTVLEGLHVELLEEGSLTGLDLLSLGADLEVLGDFDLSLHDLGGDVEGVEEVDLGGVEAGGAGGAGVVDGGDDTHAGLGGDFVGFDLALEFVDGGVAEDEGDLLLEERGEDLEFFDFSAELLFEVSELGLFNAFDSHFDDLLDEGLRGGWGTFLEMTRMLL